MMKFAAFLVVFLTMFTISQSNTCRYERAQGVVKASFRTSSHTSKNKIDCLVISCDCASSCAVSFNPVSKLCWRALLVPLHDTSSYITDTDPWVTYYLPSDRSSGLWMFDDVTRGKNLGSRGYQLDWTVPGLVWNTIGPRGSLAPKYATYLGPGIPTMQPPLDGSNGFDFEKPYSIVFWVKTIYTYQPMVVLDTFPDRALDLFFEPSYEQDQISLSPDYFNHTYVTFQNSDGRNNWRHIAITYQKPGNVSFYLNENIWHHTAIMVSTKVSQPERFCVFKHCIREKRMWGSLTCLAIFERVLYREEIRFLKETCP